jgi:transcriptional regulator with XRE-family HTH domain
MGSTVTLDLPHDYWKQTATDLRVSFPARLLFVREMRGMSQVQLAKAMGADPSFISQLEHGRRLPAAENIVGLCRALLVSSDYLLGLSQRIAP